MFDSFSKQDKLITQGVLSKQRLDWLHNAFVMVTDSYQIVNNSGTFYFFSLKLKNMKISHSSGAKHFMFSKSFVAQPRKQELFFGSDLPVMTCYYRDKRLLIWIIFGLMEEIRLFVQVLRGLSLIL